MPPSPGVFLVARNPDPESSLPYLLRLPLGRGLILKAREPWPVSSRVYCHPHEEAWPDEAEVVESVGVRACQRRGPAIDLVLDRRQRNRSQFVFTTFRGRRMIFWQTPAAARASRPGVRVPRRKAPGAGPRTIEVDTRERYPYKFGGRAETVRAAIPAGDYGIRVGGELVAVVERKTLDDLSGALVDGSLAFRMAELSTLPAAAVVVEDRYSRLLTRDHVRPGWLVELLTRLQTRYRNVPVFFADSRKLAEDWTYRFLAAASDELASALEPGLLDG